MTYRTRHPSPGPELRAGPEEGYPNAALGAVAPGGPDGHCLLAWTGCCPDLNHWAVAPLLTGDEEWRAPSVTRMQAYFAALGYALAPWVNDDGERQGWMLDRRTAARPSPSWFETPGHAWQWWARTASDQLYLGKLASLVFAHFQKAGCTERMRMRRWLATTFDPAGVSGWRDTLETLERETGATYSSTPDPGWSERVTVLERAALREVTAFRDRLALAFDQWELDEERRDIDAACSPAVIERVTRRL